jgi:hypothetical protein
MIKNCTTRLLLLSVIFLSVVYQCVLAENARTSINITNKNVCTTSYVDKELILDGKSELHLRASTLPLSNSIVRLNSADSWVFFDNIRPQVVVDSLLQYIYVNQSSAIQYTNVRVAVYKQGTVVIPHASSIKPLTVFLSQNLTGDSTNYGLNTRQTSLGTFNNCIRSFRLKRGYMATLATNADGTGYSRVFIADDEDLEYSTLGTELDSIISFIRVLPHEYVTKKGYGGGETEANQMNATWRYNWSASGSTTNNIEFVPIRHNSGWPSFETINALEDVTHLLGFNEPDHSEQADMTVSEAIAQWPYLLQSGLRLGSPACTDFSWLYAFMDSCEARNYRVDYVAVHAYWGSKSYANWYNDLKTIHEKTGRPIWITEWNNGANWTTESWPTDSLARLQQQLTRIKGILQVLDTAHFIERYAIYNWVEDKRAMVIDGNVTPAGEYYSNDTSEIAFRRINEVIPTYTYSSDAPTLKVSFGTSTFTLTVSDPNGEYARGFILEKKIDNGSFTKLYESSDQNTTTYNTTYSLTEAKRIRYRVRTKLANGNYSSYSNEVGIDITGGSDFQYGNVTTSDIGWNMVFFNKSYSSSPAIIIGAPTNKNSSVLFTSRAKLISASTRFGLQILPWSYQEVTDITSEESIPYFVSAIGTMNFDGLTGLAGKATVSSSWTTVTFSTAFDTIPVVFTSSRYPSNTIPTTIRIRNVSKTGFQAKILKESTTTTTPSSETVSFFAITPGTGSIENKKVIVGKTATNAIGSVYTSISYGDSLSAPLFIAQMQTCNDDTVAACVRNILVSNKYAYVLKQRERSLGIYTTTSETGGWMALDTASYIVSGIEEATLSGTLTIYPNPVSNTLFFSTNNLDCSTIMIYNLYGVLVKQASISGNSVEVSDLKAGYYLLKTKDGEIHKFIKE